MLQALASIAVAISTLFTIVLLLLPSQYITKRHSTPSKHSDGAESFQECSAQVIVLGDIGRSPRMQYHALSIAKHGGSVQLVGYLDTEPLPALRTAKVSIIPIAPSPAVLQTSNQLLFLALAPVKVLFQIWSLWYALGYKTSPSKWMLVQNPPSIPTLLIAVVVCFLRNTKLVVDWHNFGYTILALKLGQGHPLVAIARIYEHLFAKCADANFAVTEAMTKLLQKEFIPNAPILALHDRPAAIFQPLNSRERVQFLSEHALTKQWASMILDEKVRLVVSSTSWTPDEDFSVFLEALCNYSDSATSTHPQLPELVVVITGKGPQKDFYLHQIDEFKKQDKLEMVTVKTAWLSFDDYAALLGAADLGVSLHTSSSGVDLPMKVVDMFGAGLPVAGYSNYQAWPELVTENVNGRGFVTSDELSGILKDLFEPGNVQLPRLKEGAVVESRRRWDGEWDSVAGKLFGVT